MWFKPQPQPALVVAINNLTHKLGEFMAEIDDLNAGIAASTAAMQTLQTAVTDAATELQNVATALNNAKAQTPIDPAAVEAAAQTLAGTAQNLTSAGAALEAAVQSAKTSTGV